MEICCWKSSATDEVLEEIWIGVDRILLGKIIGEAREMRQEFVRRGNPIDTCGRSYGSLSVGRTWEYCGSSTVGEVRKDVAQGWTSAESREGHSRYELRLEGYFIPSTSPPTFEFEFRMKYREIFTAEVAPLNSTHDRPQISWHLMRTCRSLFKSR